MSYPPDRPNISPGYLSYLLRLCHTQSGGDSVWRVSLEEPLTKQVVRFDTLPDLFNFLLVQTGQRSEGSQSRQVDGLEGSMPLTRKP